jgi:hypothetical protein
MEGATPGPSRSGPLLHAGFTLVFLVVATWSLVGLVSAELGVYRPRVVAVVSLTAALAGGWGIRRSLRDEAWRVPSRGVYFLAACVGLAAFLFLQPGEYLIDGGDGSVYLNLGRAVARAGGLSFPEPMLDEVDPALWPRLFDRDVAWPHRLNLFPGGIQIAPGANRVQPNFFHLFPVWVANIEAVAGERGGYYANAVFGLLAIAAVWMLGVRLSSLTAGTAAAVLLAISFAEIWFARFPTSEMLTQYLILAGLYFAVALGQRPSLPSAAFAGAAFGLASLTRLDALVLVSPVVGAYLVLTAGARPRHWRVFAAVFGALTLHAIVHALVWSRPYTERVAWHLAGGWVKPGSLVAPAAALVVALLWWRWTASGRSVRRALWLVTGIAVTLVLARLAPRAIAGYPAMLLTTGGLAAAVAGAVMLAAKPLAAAAPLVVAVYAVSSLVYLDSVRDMTAMPMLLRRFVPVVLPLTLLLAAHAFSYVSSLHARLRWIAWAGPAGLAIVLATGSAPLIAAPAMQGVAAQVAALAARLPPGAVVIVDGSTPSHLGLSLHYTEGRDVLWIRRGEGTAAAIELAATSLRARGRGVLLLVTPVAEPHDDWLRADDVAAFSVRPAGSSRLTYREMEPTTDRLPSRVREVTTMVELYEISPVAPEALPLLLDLGESDFAWRRDGFYDAEQMGPATARWTGTLASIAVPRVETAAGTLVLRMRLAGPRPPGVAPPVVQVDLDGRPVGTTPALSAAFQIYELPLDAVEANALLSGPTRLTLRVPGFVPADTAGGSDHRQLGAAVDWIRVERR